MYTVFVIIGENINFVVWFVQLSSTGLSQKLVFVEVSNFQNRFGLLLFFAYCVNFCMGFSFVINSNIGRNMVKNVEYNEMNEVS